MGSSESKDDNMQIKTNLVELVDEKDTNESNPSSSFPRILKSNQATCKIKVNNTSGTGFFATIPVIKNNMRMCGLITSNHVLSMNELLQGRTFSLIFDSNRRKKEIKLDDKKFRFTCPLIDISFIEFSPDELDRSVRFLELNESISKANESAFITQQSSSNDCSIAQGVIKEIWGFDINHSVSVGSDYSGAPLMNNEGIVIGVQKSSSNNEICNKATDIYYLITALSNFIKNEISSFALTVGNSKKLSLADIKKLNEHGLQSTDSPFVFISPRSKNVTPLWFYRSNFAWFWTPTEPKSFELSDIKECNWSLIDLNFEIKAIGGKYDQVSPAQRNVDLISWLAKTGLNFIT